MAIVSNPLNRDKQDGKNALSDYQKMFRMAKSARENLESDWFLNLAYYNGDQWIFWNRGRIDRPRLAAHRVKMVDNRILPAVDTRIARKTKNLPTFVATPFSADEKDRRNAALGEKILENDWEQLSLSERHMRAMKWAELTGAAFWKVYWDSTKGETVNYAFRDGQPMLDQNKRPMRAEQLGDLVGVEGVEVKPIHPGDIGVDVISPFEIFPDPLANALEEAEWIIEQKVRSTDYIKERYGKDVEKDTDVSSGIAESRMFPSSVGGFSGSSTSSSQYRGTTLYEFWAAPSPTYPGGRRAVWTRDKLLIDEDLTNAPYDGNPYVMFSGIMLPGRFWPTCVTTQLRGPQTELNKLESQVVENAQRLGNPALLKSRQANVTYTGKPGEEVAYDSTVPDAIPRYLEAPSIPGYISNQIDRLIDSMSEISGMHEVSNATVPAGVTAASAINLLQEADDTRLGPEIASMEDTIAEAGTKILRLRARFTSEERLIQIAGDEGDWDVVSYRGSMLENVTNVQVQAGSTMPRSKAAKQAAMEQLLDKMLQYGVPVDERSMRKFLKEFEIGGLDNLFTNINSNELQVVRENMSFSQGIPVNINTFDDDDFHIDGHEDFQKGLRYAESFDDQMKGAYELHVNAHRERKQKQVDLQLKAQQDAQDAEMQHAVKMQQLQSQPNTGGK